MNGTLYVQKANEDGSLTAGWIHEKPGREWICFPLGPGKDVLTADLEKALVFDLNNHCEAITAYIDAGWTVRTGNNLLHSPKDRRPNCLTIA